MDRWLKLVLFGALAIALLVITFYAPAQSSAIAQQPTGSVATVTGTSSGPFVTVYADLAKVEVYAGPSTYLYPAVGVLLAGQNVPALGRGSDPDWIQVFYPGVTGSKAWVYAPYVRISLGAFDPSGAPPDPFFDITIDPPRTFLSPQRQRVYHFLAEIIIPTFW
jgi:hypothetical protein